MPVFTQLKAAIFGGIVLVVLIIGGLIYWRGSSNANTKNELRVAREVIKTERETLKVTSQIDLRVNAEGIQTANTAQEATREIEAIRNSTSTRARTGDGHLGMSRPDRGVDMASSGGGGRSCDSDCTRVLQLAREARAEAVASSARLQPAGAGTR